MVAIFVNFFGNKVKAVVESPVCLPYFKNYSTGFSRNFSSLTSNRNLFSPEWAYRFKKVYIKLRLAT